MKMFREEYENNLSFNEYIYLDYKKVMNYYYLLFASKHKKGLEFWHKANKIDPNGQSNMIFD